jgi:hypothetical protein
MQHNHGKWKYAIKKLLTKMPTKVFIEAKTPLKQWGSSLSKGCLDR